MSSFVSTAKRSSNQNSSISMPGPGDYNAVQPSSTYSHNYSKSVFSSKTSRGWNIQTDVPAPGQYENPVQLGQGNCTHQSIFRSKVKRLDLDASSTPGPGAYNADDAESALRLDWVARSHTSAAFHVGNTDRFGRLPGKTVTECELGPGAYEVSALADQVSLKQGYASVFKSKTFRGEGTKGNAQKGSVPGPAFYHPASSEKRSHLLNANKKWL